MQAAIKCPSLADHLTGAKKMQQVLAQPGVLEKFTAGLDDGVAEAVRATFAGLYELDDTEAGAKATAEGLANPGRYVLKPQREGGGNNLYDDELKAALAKMGPSERAGYILMDRIVPTT